MRAIRKRAVPNALAQWRVPRLDANRSGGMECTYAEMRRDPAVLEAVENNLFGEQGGICAYTGQRIGLTPESAVPQHPRMVDFHIEHLTPQAHCSYGQDTDYTNMVACWPRPNCGFEPAYGARKKGSWPSLPEQLQFISPLRVDCSTRFAFNRRGEISAAKQGDTAAQATIELRRAAIRGVLNPAARPIRLTDARRLLQRIQRDMDDVNRGVSIQLLPFCFAVQPALEREVRKLEAITNICDLHKEHAGDMTNRSLLALATSTLSALGVTLVPMGGFFLAGWNPATVLVLYLLETLVGILLTEVRVWFLDPQNSFRARPTTGEFLCSTNTYLCTTH